MKVNGSGKWRWGRFSPRTSVSTANLHSICFSTIIFTITQGWHHRPGVAAVPIASQSKLKKMEVAELLSMLLRSGGGGEIMLFEVILCRWHKFYIMIDYG
jgi:hypothetical protein